MLTNRIKPKCQRGAMLVISSFLILAILLVGALVIEYLRFQHVALALQRSADVAALAGARVLRQSPAVAGVGYYRTNFPPNNPDLVWQQSKRAVFAGLKLNPIGGAPIDVQKFDPKNSTLAPANTDPGALECTHTMQDDAVKNGSEFACSNFVFTENGLKVIVSIQRQLVFIRNDLKQVQFLPLEPIEGNSLNWNFCYEAFQGFSNAVYPISCCGVTAADPKLSVAQVANSVRVVMRLEGLHTFLGSFFGVTTLPPILRESVASPEPMLVTSCQPN